MSTGGPREDWEDSDVAYGAAWEAALNREDEMTANSTLTRRKLLMAGGLAGAAATLAAFPAPFVRAQSARKLVFWHGFTEGARADFMAGAAKRFEALNPGLTIEIETVPWPTYSQKWPAAMVGGTLPDVAVLLGEEAVPMFLSGALNTTNDLVNDLGGEAAFTPGLIAANSRYKGEWACRKVFR